MDLDLVLGDTDLVCEEGADLLSLIALKLDDLAGILVVDNGSVASEFFLESFENLLEIILCAWRNVKK